MFRIDPEVHVRSALAAQLVGLSMNEWGERALRHAAERATAKS
jgi:predicted HicB family RNase H-like nuclease